MARLAPEFQKRNTKVIGLSIDPGGRPQALGEGHRGDAGDGAELSDHRRHRPERREALRHDPSQRHGREAHGRRQRDRALGVRDRARQEGQAHADLSHEHGPQLRRGAARARLHPAHGQAQGGDARELEAGRGRDHRARRVRRRGEAEVSGRLEVRRPSASMSCRKKISN